MEFHVTDIMINAPHVKRKLWLPVWIKRVTGVLFFPVVPIPAGEPDGAPLGVAALSLHNEKVNAVTNMSVFKKAPCYYESEDTEGGGEVFLDRGYGYFDFYACNDVVAPNSYALFKWANRKNVKSLTQFENFQKDLQRLMSLIGKVVLLDGYSTLSTRYLKNVTFNDVSVYLVFSLSKSLSLFPNSASDIRISIARSQLPSAIYQMKDKTGKPYFTPSNDADSYDEPYKLKIILRYETE